MTSKSQNIIEVLNQVYSNLNRPLKIVETGTIRNLNEGFIEGDGYSTQFIAEWIRDNSPESHLASIDLSTNIAMNYLKARELLRYVTLITLKGTDELISHKSIDFCYLDSADDPDNCLNEFLIAWPKITKGGALMADDCSLEVKECRKGDKLIPYLLENNIPFEYRSNKVFGNTQIVLWK